MMEEFHRILLSADCSEMVRCLLSDSFPDGTEKQVKEELFQLRLTEKRMDIIKNMETWPLHTVLTG